MFSIKPVIAAEESKLKALLSRVKAYFFRVGVALRSF